MSDEKRIKWYSHQGVKYEIVKALKNKEFQIIGDGLSMRWLSMQFVGMYDIIFEHLHLLTRKCSMYRSLDSYDTIPRMSFNPQKRLEESAKWQLERAQHVTGCDFGIDLDFKDGTWKDAIPQAEILRSLFERFGVRFAFWCSGSHGFHFVVPFEDMPESVKQMPYEARISFYRAFAGHLSEKITSIDLSIYMPTRVLKCPYTLDKHGNVIFPLDYRTWQLLQTSSQSILDPEQCLHNFGHALGYRGIYLQGDTDGIKRMIVEWEGWE